MDKTLREHVTALEQRLNTLSSRLMEENSLQQRNEFEAELRAVQSALAHYREAIKLESTSRGSPG